MTDLSDTDELESYLRVLSGVLTSPYPRECLVCFVARMLDDFGCDETLRFARRFRDLRVPRASRLEERLGHVGAFCDCEIFLNGYVRADHLAGSDEALIQAGRTPLCLEVPGGSTQPCCAWERQSRRS